MHIFLDELLDAIFLFKLVDFVQMLLKLYEEKHFLLQNLEWKFLFEKKFGPLC